jgi:pectate lyase
MFKSTKVISSVVGFVMLFALISGLLILNKQSVYGKTGSGTYTIIVKANSDGIYGDLNGDKIVDSRDITLLGRYILEIYDFDDKQLKYADLNLDSRVDSIDYNIMRRYLLEIIDTIPIGGLPSPTPTLAPTHTPTQTTSPTPTTTPTPTPVHSIADGFAEGTTGGEDGTIVTVTNATELRNAAGSSSKMVIIVDGNIDLGSTELKVASDKTIQGKNSNSTIKGCISIKRVNNVIIRNLNITNPDGAGTGDGIEISGSTKVFVTKCTFYDCSDGSLDVVRASDFVTISWCRFRYINQREHNFVNLIGNSDSASNDAGKLHVTLHHNWYDTGCDQRMPRVRFGKVHVYNNYFGCPNALYNIGVGVYSEILVENNYFENQKSAWRNYSNNSSDQGKIRWNNGNAFVNTAIPSWAPNSYVFTPPYAYNMDFGNNVKNIVTAGAGNR